MDYTRKCQSVHPHQMTTTLTIMMRWFITTIFVSIPNPVQMVLNYFIPPQSKSTTNIWVWPHSVQYRERWWPVFDLAELFSSYSITNIVLSDKRSAWGHLNPPYIFAGMVVIASCSASLFGIDKNIDVEMLVEFRRLVHWLLCCLVLVDAIQICIRSSCSEKWLFDILCDVIWKCCSWPWFKKLWLIFKLCKREHINYCKYLNMPWPTLIYASLFWHATWNVTIHKAKMW